MKLGIQINVFGLCAALGLSKTSRTCGCSACAFRELFYLFKKYNSKYTTILVLWDPINRMKENISLGLLIFGANIRGKKNPRTTQVCLSMIFNFCFSYKFLIF